MPNLSLFLPQPQSNTRWRVLAALLILGVAAVRLAWLISCPLDLAPDEAHYWDWSRHLDWSYYSKGPLVAWLIRAGIWLAGPWAEHLTGHATLAVRLPALVCGVLFLISLYILTRQTFGDERLSVLTVAVALTLPPVAVMSSIMTIDAPYITCWGWALVLAHHAIFPLRIADCELRISDQSAIRNPQSAIVWAMLGFIIGLGILAKYTMVVFIPSLALFLLFSPDQRYLLRRPGFWTMCVVAGLCTLPILIWNIQHDWVTVKHVGVLAGVDPTRSRFRWLGPLNYLGAQAALLLGFWFVAWLVAMIAHRPWREPNARLRFLWWLSAPMFLVFFAFSPRTGGGEINWPVTAYVSGLVLTVGWLARLFQTSTVQRRAVLTCGFASIGLFGITISILMHTTDAAYPVLGRLADRLYPEKPFAIRQLDPTCRLRGWRALAAEVDRIREELLAAGEEPIVAASAWFMPGELGFYCTGQPTVYSLGLAIGDRHSQYDLWHPNPVAERENFQGRTFVLVGEFPAHLETVFDSVSAPISVIHRVGARPVSSWPVTVCRGFRGFTIVPDGAKH